MISFTQVPFPSGPEWKAITFGNGRYVALNATDITAISADGVDWAIGVLPPLAVGRSWTSIAFGNGVFVALNDDYWGHFAAVSPDGVTWAAHPLPYGYYYHVAFGDGLFVVPGKTEILTSTDGVLWTPLAHEFGSTTPSSIVSGGGKFVVTDSEPASPAKVYTTAGTGAVTRSYLGGYLQTYAAMHGGGKFVVCSSAGAATSADGTTWGPILSRAVGFYTPVGVFGDGKFVVVGPAAYSNGPSAVAEISNDGVSWETVALPASARWSGVAYGAPGFVAIGGANTAVFAAVTGGVLPLTPPFWMTLRMTQETP